MNDPMFLTLDEVLELHAYQIGKFGGSPDLREIGLLESAIDIPEDLEKLVLEVASGTAEKSSVVSFFGELIRSQYAE
jgi:hypothetical protein